MKRLYIKTVNPKNYLPITFEEVEYNENHKSDFSDVLIRTEVILPIDGFFENLSGDTKDVLIDYLRTHDNLFDYLKEITEEFKQVLDIQGIDTNFNNYIELYSVIVPQFTHFYHVPTKQII